jgi:serine/threonine protein kinase/WD40 repeat protein
MPSSDSSREALLERLAEEFVERHRRGDRPALSEYADRHPDLAADIRDLFPALVKLERLKPVAGDLTGGFAPEPGPGGGHAPERLGDYRILREVGHGGMGVVYEAEQESLGRHVALKVLPRQALFRSTYLERFRREAKAAAKLHHTNIVPVFGVGEADGVHFYAMQYIAGEGLDKVLCDLRQLRGLAGAPAAAPLPSGASMAHGLLTGRFAAPAAAPAEGAPAGPGPPTAGGAHGFSTLSASGPEVHYYRGVARVAVQVADALAYAHRQGVLHRDIKPSNLLLDQQGTVWVTDFGLAKAEGADDLTHTGDIVGTVRYMAPERFDGRSLPQSDLYALGVTLYELLTLRPAFDDANHARLVEKLLREAPTPPRKLDPHIPRDLETVVLKCLAKDPAERYASAEALAEDVRRFLADRPVKARRSPWYERTWRWCHRNPAVATLLGVVALLLGALTVGTLLANASLRSSLHDANQANEEKNVRLWESLRDRARAVRMSGRVGQRLEALQSIREALALPLPPGHTRAELRTEAIAALALPDIDIEKEWEGPSPGTVAWGFDAAVERYADLMADATVTVHRVADGAEVARWKEDGFAPCPGSEQCLTLSPDGRYVAVYHAGLRQLRVRRLDGEKAVLCHEADHVRDWARLPFSPNSALLVYALEDGTIAVLELSTKASRFLPERLAEPHWPGISPDGKQLAVVTGPGQNVVEVRDLSTGALTARLPQPTSARSPAWHPDGQVLATFCNDRQIRLWAVAGGKLLRVLEGHRTVGGYLAFDGPSGLLLSTDWTGLLRLWEPSSGRQLLSFQADPWWISDRVDGVVAGQALDGKLRVMRLQPSRAYRTLSRTPAGSSGGFQVEGSYEPVFSGDGRLLFAATRGAGLEGVSILDAATGRELNRIPLVGNRPFLWGPGSELLTCGSAGVLRWPLTGNRERPGHYGLGPVERLVPVAANARSGVSPDGSIIAIPIPASRQGAVVWDRDQGKLLLRLPPQNDVRYAAVSPDGRWVATGCFVAEDAFGARVWDAHTGQPVKALPVAGGCRVAFSPDGRWLLTTGGGSRLWRTETWEGGPVLGGHACFAPDSRLLAVEGDGGTIRLVEAESGVEVARLAAPVRANVVPLCFSPDGTQLVAGEGESETLIVWDLRALRQDLQALDLDWEAPPYPPAAARGPRPPISVDVDLGNFAQRAQAGLLVAQATNQLNSGQPAWP